MPAAREHPRRRGARGTLSLVALGLAGAWCGALLVGAVIAPVYSGESTTAGSVVHTVTGETTSAGVAHTSATLVEVNGVWALAVVALPLLPVVAIAMVLRHRRRAGQPGAGAFAWGTVCLLWLFAVVTGFTIGPFVMPIVGFLAIACAAAPRAAPSILARPMASTSVHATATQRRPWLPFLLLAVAWFAVSEVVPGPALWLAFVVATVGVVIGVARYRDDAAALMPNALYVGISLLAGSGVFLLVAYLGT